MLLLCTFRAMFSSREYCKSRVVGLAKSAWPNFGGTRVLPTLARLIPSATVEDLKGYSTACFELGGDAWGILRGVSKTHSMGGLFVRGTDIAEGDKNRRAYHYPLALIPGPKQPKNMSGILDMVVEELLCYQPGEGGRDLVVHPTACWDSFGCTQHGGKSFVFRACLC